MLDNAVGKDFSPLLAAPEAAGLNAVRDGALFNYGMLAYLDADFDRAALALSAQKGSMSDEEFRARAQALPIDWSNRGAIRSVFDGRYRFITIKPGAYPWRNHDNAWRPAHIHLSVFGRAFTERLVTQMYFPGDPLFAYDPIYQSVRDPQARERMVSTFDLASTKPEWALAYRYDIVLGGSGATPLESA